MKLWIFTPPLAKALGLKIVENCGDAWVTARSRDLTSVQRQRASAYTVDFAGLRKCCHVCGGASGPGPHVCAGEMMFVQPYQNVQLYGVIYNPNATGHFAKIHYCIINKDRGGTLRGTPFRRRRGFGRLG
jgi:hypothetical protein